LFQPAKLDVSRVFRRIHRNVVAIAIALDLFDRGRGHVVLAMKSPSLLYSDMPVTPPLSAIFDKLPINMRPQCVNVCGPA
jgi:hypothetical protein